MVYLISLIKLRLFDQRHRHYCILVKQKRDWHKYKYLRRRGENKDTLKDAKGFARAFIKDCEVEFS